MHNNGNNSSENGKSSVSLDAIINEFNGNIENTEADSKASRAKKKLDEIFKTRDDDLAWLDSLINDKAETIPEEEPDEEYFSEEFIRAENADDDAEESESTEAPEEAAALEVEGDVKIAFSEEKSEPEAEAEIDTNDNDGKTKVHNAVKPKEPHTEYSNEIGFDIFEGDASPEEIAGGSIESDDVSKSLNALFGLAAEEEPEAEEEEKPEKKKKENKIKPPKAEKKSSLAELAAYEEIDMANPVKVAEGHTKYYQKKAHALLSLLGAAIFFLVGLYVELAPIASLPHPEILSGAHPVVYALIDLQIMCFAAMCLVDSLYSGVLAIIDKRFSPASAAVCVFAVCGVSAVVSAIYGGADIRLFCSVGALTLLSLAMYDYFKASADDKSYKIASSISNKFGAFEVSCDSPECSPFESHINKDVAKAITVKKGSVYEGFAERNARRPDSEKKLGKLTAIVAIVAFLSGVFLAIANASLYSGLCGAVIIFISSVPINMFFVSALPKFLAAKKGKEFGAALIGQNASEEYKGLAVVAFDDTEVFLPKDVRISSIKTYNGMALDQAVVFMAKIYAKIGGPLSKIFAKMVDVKGDADGVELTGVCPDALELTVDGKDICLATQSYLSATGVRVVSDSVDAAFTQSHGSILFMVSEGKILSKFYIKYSVNPTFEKTLADLHEANLCVGIKTLDPCINNDLIFGCLEKSNYALSVVKGSGKNDIPKVSQKVSSGVIALGSVHKFLQMLLLCERTGRNVKINNVIKYASAILCLILSLVFVMTNSALDVIFCIILQLFCILPVALISYYNK